MPMLNSLLINNQVLRLSRSSDYYAIFGASKYLSLFRHLEGISMDDGSLMFNVCIVWTMTVSRSLQKRGWRYWSRHAARAQPTFPRKHAWNSTWGGLPAIEYYYTMNLTATCRWFAREQDTIRKRTANFIFYSNDHWRSQDINHYYVK